MYQLDLADERLALPVAIYTFTTASSHTRLATATAMPESVGSREIAFFAPDRPGLASMAVRECRDGDGNQSLVVASDGAGTGSSTGDTPPVFYALPAKGDKPPPGTVLLYEFRQQTGPSRYYSVVEDPRPGYRRTPEPIGRVWKDPSRLKIW
jgi:hypothetical protein